MISVLILTLNEEANLPDCLESVSWSDDVVLVDSFSTDKTVSIAAGAGVRVLQNRFVNFADQRNFGLTNVRFRYDWVLHLDADERVTSELRDEMLAAVKSEAKDAYQVASRITFQGRWLRYSGLYPSYQVRLGRHGVLRFIQVGHGQRESLDTSRVGTLRSPLIHHCFSKGLEAWFDKHNRYSTQEAAETLKSLDGGQWTVARCVREAIASRDPVRRRRALKELSFRLPCRPALRFFYMYILRRGFLDGVPGYHYCRLLAIYEYLIVLKMKEARWGR